MSMRPVYRAALRAAAVACGPIGPQHERRGVVHGVVVHEQGGDPHSGSSVAVGATVPVNGDAVRARDRRAGPPAPRGEAFPPAGLRVRQAKEAIDRSCGKVLGRRQAEQLVIAAAADIDVFYQHKIPLPSTAATALVLQADGKASSCAPRPFGPRPPLPHPRAAQL